ncbi:hypothetical protein HDU96_003452 [Phlyctochytrium bullatum]|nr:hypothetical protein HDU96_003452 [Phlyctochytrium bullatum]
MSFSALLARLSTASFEPVCCTRPSARQPLRAVPTSHLAPLCTQPGVSATPSTSAAPLPPSFFAPRRLATIARSLRAAPWRPRWLVRPLGRLHATLSSLGGTPSPPPPFFTTPPAAPRGPTSRSSGGRWVGLRGDHRAEWVEELAPGSARLTWRGALAATAAGAVSAHAVTVVLGGAGGGGSSSSSGGGGGAFAGGETGATAAVGQGSGGGAGSNSPPASPRVGAGRVVGVWRATAREAWGVRNMRREGVKAVGGRGARGVVRFAPVAEKKASDTQGERPPKPRRRRASSGRRWRMTFSRKHREAYHQRQAAPVPAATPLPLSVAPTASEGRSADPDPNPGGRRAAAARGDFGARFARASAACAVAAKLGVAMALAREADRVGARSWRAGGAAVATRGFASRSGVVRRGGRRGVAGVMEVHLHFHQEGARRRDGVVGEAERTALVAAIGGFESVAMVPAGKDEAMRRAVGVAGYNAAVALTRLLNEGSAVGEGERRRMESRRRRLVAHAAEYGHERARFWNDVWGGRGRYELGGGAGARAFGRLERAVVGSPLVEPTATRVTEDEGSLKEEEEDESTRAIDDLASAMESLSTAKGETPRGIGCLEAARARLERSARSGSYLSAYNLGVLLCRMGEDEESAIHWFEVAKACPDEEVSRDAAHNMEVLLARRRRAMA